MGDLSEKCLELSIFVAGPVIIGICKICEPELAKKCSPALNLNRIN